MGKAADTKRTKVHLAIAAALLFLLAIPYAQVRHHEFVDFDDATYIVENPKVKYGFSHEGLVWASGFRNQDRSYWRPLTWLTHMLDFELFGDDPGKHHLTNLLLHLANVLLLYVGLYRLTGRLWRSAMVAALFAVHPINVESVAWVTERSNLLSTCLGLSTLLLYTLYCERPSRSRYFKVIFTYLLCLMAKPILITLPFLMLVLDVWPLKRLSPGAMASRSSRDRYPQKAFPCASGQTIWNRYRGSILHCLREKLPLMGLGLGAVVFSLIRLGRIISVDHIPLPLRISNAIVSYVKYLWHLLWPFDLAALYPFPSHVPAWQVIGSLVLLVGLTALFLYYLQRAPYLMVGWLWFLGTLFPKIGLVQAGLWPALADRWAYFPAIGLFFAIVWSAAEIWSLWSVLKRRMLAFSAAIYIVFLTMLCHVQVGYWANSTVLFERMIDKTEGNYMAHNNLGYVLIKEKRYDEARRHFEKSIAINPKFEIPYVNIGTIHKDQGQTDKAIDWYHKALAINPKNARGHLNIGNLYFSREEYVQAIHHYARGIEVDSDSALLYNSLGAALTKLGRLDEATRCFQTALRIDPGLKMASKNLEAIIKARSERNSG